MAQKENTLQRRERRIRHRLKAHAGGKPRLTIFRSNQYIYAQIIDDKAGVTIVSASSLEKDLREKLKKGKANIEAAKIIGTLVAERAKQAKVGAVVFDRGSYLYHGRIKALADAARAAGLAF